MTSTKAKVRRVRRPTTYPSFRQLCAIVRWTITRHPTDCEADLKEAIKRRHLHLGYLYSNDQIPRAMDAVEREMGRYFLTSAKVAALIPPPPLAQQLDPPWRPYRRGSSTWTSLRELLARLTNARSDRSI